MSSGLRRSALAVLALAWALSSCGGGGSDGPGGGGGTATPSISLTNIAIPPRDLEIFEGEPFDVAIVGDLTGDLSVLSNRTLHVIVEDPQQLFGQGYVVAGSGGLGNSLTVAGRQNLPAGRFNGALRVSLCLDAACASRIANTPVSIPYALTILPALKVTPATPIVLETAFGTAAQASVAVTVPTGADSWNAHVEPGNFLNGTFSSSQSDVPASNVVVRGELACAGTFSSRLSVHAVGQTSTGRRVPMDVRVPVTYRVTAATQPAMAVESSRNAFSVNTTDRTYDAFTVTARRQACVRLESLVRSVQYLPGGPSGNLDAGAARWLTYSNSSGIDAYSVQSTLSVQRCSMVFPEPPQLAYQACLAPGRYDAIVQLADYLSDGTEVLVPFPLSVTVEM